MSARLAAVVCLLAACRQGESRRAAARYDAAPVRVADAAPVARDPLVPAITDPALLAGLEEQGLRLGALLGAEQAVSNAELDAASPLYRDFATFSPSGTRSSRRTTRSTR